jgi:hypothetical protein
LVGKVTGSCNGCVKSRVTCTNTEQEHKRPEKKGKGKAEPTQVAKTRTTRKRARSSPETVEDSEDDETTPKKTGEAAHPEAHDSAGSVRKKQRATPSGSEGSGLLSVGDASPPPPTPEDDSDVWMPGPPSGQPSAYGGSQSMSGQSGAELMGGVGAVRVERLRGRRLEIRRILPEVRRLQEHLERQLGELEEELRELNAGV